MANPSEKVTGPRGVSSLQNPNMSKKRLSSNGEARIVTHELSPRVKVHARAKTGVIPPTKDRVNQVKDKALPDKQ